MLGIPVLVLVGSLIGLAASSAKDRRYHTTVDNPVLTSGPEGTEPFVIPEWPNWKSNANTYIGKCGIAYTHTNHSACISPAHADACGRRLRVYRMPDWPKKRWTEVTVVDFCPALKESGLYVTADAYREIGGKLHNGSLSDVAWKYIGNSSETKEPKQMDQQSLTAMSTMTFGFILWSAGIALLL